MRRWIAAFASWLSSASGDGGHAVALRAASAGSAAAGVQWDRSGTPYAAASTRLEGGSRSGRSCLLAPAFLLAFLVVEPEGEVASSASTASSGALIGGPRR